MIYAYHRLSCHPLQWKNVADALASNSAALEHAKGCLYGIWRSQIGRPRDELTVLTYWQEVPTDEAVTTAFRELSGVRSYATQYMVPSLRPTSPSRPVRQGNYAFRSFELKAKHWKEFLSLSNQYWPAFEATYDSQVIGLWRVVEPSAPTPDDQSQGEAIMRSLLLTRRPNLAMWERSKMPQTEEEAIARQAMIRRYDICDATEVFTTTLLNADDAPDNVRWT